MSERSVINDVRVSGVVVNIRFNDILRSVCPCCAGRGGAGTTTVCVKGLLVGFFCINNTIITLKVYSWVFTVVVMM